MSNKPPESTSFRPPVPYRGQTVLWYEGGVKDDSRSAPAIVKVEGHSSVHLHVYGLDHQFDITCVRHIDDPSAKEWDRTDNGCWDFCKPDRKLPGNVTQAQTVGAK